MRAPVLLLVALFAVSAVSAMSAVPSTDILADRKALDDALEARDDAQVVEIAGRLVASQAQDASLWYELGRSAFAVGRHDLAITASRRAWDLGYRSMPWIALRIARSSAVLERDIDALDWLQRALDHGFEDRQALLKIPELARLHDSPRFRALAGITSPKNRSEGIAADVDFLLAEAARLHPEYLRRKAAFEKAGAELKSRASDLTDREVLFGLTRMVALLGDGHSSLYGPGEGTPLNVPGGALPVLFYLFDDGLFVVDGEGPGAELVGRQVSKIGRRTPHELLEFSRQLHGAENSMTMKWLGVHFSFPQASFLLEADAIDDPARVALELVSATGETETVVLTAGSHDFPRKLRPVDREGVPTPRYLKNVETSFSFELLESHRAVYFQFNQVRDKPEESISAFAQRLSAVLQNPRIRHLIVDVRHNNGGNNGLLLPLLREIVAFDTRPDHQVWVITGRGTFSAAQNFVNHLERWTGAIFVGEPSSSSPNFVGEETEILLPWTRIHGSISSRYWQDSDPGDDRSWIAPQIAVAPTARDYFEGRDAALEAILQAAGGE